ncbi:hypothetical protein P6F26_09400 [Roseibacterium sp. SDUM158017]|uniref:hypothetical protein n=1 Tax=Roseicyclus salinarum TaxID=3036773 RepID=UPI0024151762|nr:hypothetical protein [Roseibacterium sp. SDUM158017]MDG4648662.1 hypothetical protein [Roseibacterium sp. SDUM158017]
MDPKGTLVYLPDAETVAGLHPDWPSDMCAALCLGADGDCDVVVFHADESDRALRTVARLTGRDRAGFVVFPHRDDAPVRRLSFAEEQALCGVLADAPDLVELAADYLLNYRYALETGAPVREADRQADGVADAASVSPDAPEVLLRRPRPAATLAADARPPSLSRRRRHDLFVRIFPGADTFRLTVHDGEPPLRVGDALQVERVDTLAERGQVRLLAPGLAHRAALPGDSFVVPRSTLPEEVVERWVSGDGHATLRSRAGLCLILEEYLVPSRPPRIARVAATASSFVRSCKKMRDPNSLVR